MVLEMEVLYSKSNGLELLKVFGPWKHLNASMKKKKLILHSCITHQIAFKPYSIKANFSFLINGQTNLTNWNFNSINKNLNN